MAPCEGPARRPKRGEVCAVATPVALSPVRLFVLADSQHVERRAAIAPMLADPSQTLAEVDPSLMCTRRRRPGGNTTFEVEGKSTGRPGTSNFGSHIEQHHGMRRLDCQEPQRRAERGAEYPAVSFPPLWASPRCVSVWEVCSGRRLTGPAGARVV